MPARLRVATFNLENLDDPGDPPLDVRAKALRPQLERLDADVLCLQEVNAQHPAKGEPRRLLALDRLLEGTPCAGFHRAAADPPADRHNLVVLSRWPIRALQLIRHELVPPPLVRLATSRPPQHDPRPVAWDRPILHAGIALPVGRVLHVFNMHLRAPLAAPVPGQKKGADAWRTVGGWAEGFYLASLKRAGQALEARLAVERVFEAEPDALVLAAGDLNAETEQTAVRIIRAEPEETGDRRLAARALVPLEQAVPEERRFSVLHGGRKVLLDHLLASRSLHAWFRGAEIHNEALGDEVEEEDRVPHPPESHHAAVAAEFVMPD